MNFLLFFFSYFLILASIIGYGYLFKSLLGKNNNELEVGYIGIYGIFFITTYSYFSHLFIEHSKLHNSIILFLGLFLFGYYFIKKIHDKLLKKDLILIVIIFCILFISILIGKNHDDFSYYHFAYTYNLTQEPAHFGLGKFNHGFRTPSSIFYINSLFYLPFVDYYLFNFAQVFIMGFANIIFFKNISFNKLLIKNNQTIVNIANILSLLCLVFINIFFYRISEHGTDRSAQILIFILVILLIIFFQKKFSSPSILDKIYILFGLIISLKAFYFLYIIFLIPLFFYILKKGNLRNTFKLLFLSRRSFFLILIIILVVSKYLLNTGCLLYPLYFTCFENLEWSIDKNQVLQMNNWYELWSKAGANPNWRTQEPEIYIKGFNWVKNWFELYFFNKVSDFILSLIFLLLIFYIFFLGLLKNSTMDRENLYVKILYVILIILFLEWFYNHPSLRYGGYCIIALLFFIPFSSYLIKFKIDIHKFSNLALIIFVISIMIFQIRNINRINNELKKYGYKPINETFYKIDKNYFDIQKIIQNEKNSKGFFSRSIF